MTDETKTEAKPAAADPTERPPAIPPDEMARLTDEIVGALKTVYDPEIPADIYELGLIYRVGIDDDRTIDSHIKRLRKRFKASDGEFDMIETLYGVGYRFKES